MKGIWLCVLVAGASAVPVWGQEPDGDFAHSKLVTLYSFHSKPDAELPHDNLIDGQNGVLYGATPHGGSGSGTVFALTPPSVSGGSWTETVLYAFSGAGDGGGPNAPLVLDESGNLYGTTHSGGTSNLGTIFKLSAPGSAGGNWNLSVLHNFSGGASDGAYPEAGLASDKNGALYGTTFIGGSSNFGTVFKWDASNGLSVLHSFAGGSDGANPQYGVVFGKRGELFGTTINGGRGGARLAGTVYRLAPSQGGAWSEHVLHTFKGCREYLAAPGLLTVGNNGAIYGVTYVGGSSCFYGTVFQIKPSGSGGRWQYSELHSFNNNGTDGAGPRGSVVFDKSGNLYGTTEAGGKHNHGTVFGLKPPAGGTGAWTERVLHSFSGGADGSIPRGLVYANGLFGVTYRGGTDFVGTAFQLAP